MARIIRPHDGRITNPYDQDPLRDARAAAQVDALDRMTCHAMRQFFGLSLGQRLKWILFGAKAFKPKGVPDAPVHPRSDVH